MKKAFFWALVAATGLTTGCIKSSSDASVKGDGSAAVKLSVSYQLHTFETLKKAPDDCSCWRVYQIHHDSLPVARRALSSFESAFDDRKVAERWSSLGLQVTKHSMSDRDGWRTLEIEANAPSVSDYNAKLAAALKATPDEYLTLLPWYLHTRKLLPRMPRFYKTADPTVVKAVIPVADVGTEIAALSELNEEERKTLNSQLNYLRLMRAFDEGQIKIRVKLPGTIVSVENGKQDGTDTVLLDVKGPDVTPETVSAQAKAKGLITATLKVDPGTFKIPLEDG